MNRAGLAVLLLAAWIGALGWQVRRVFFPAQAQRLALGVRAIPPGVAYYAVYRDARRVGWGQIDVDTLPAASGFRVRDNCPSQSNREIRLQESQRPPHFQEVVESFELQRFPGGDQKKIILLREGLVLRASAPTPGNFTGDHVLAWRKKVLGFHRHDSTRKPGIPQARAEEREHEPGCVSPDAKHGDVSWL